MIFNYAIRNGWRSNQNPAQWNGNLEFDLPATHPFAPVRHLTAIELGDLKKIARLFFEKAGVGHLAVLFGVLTASRSREFVLADWSEIDLKKKVWAVPSERRKDRKPYPHRVPLSTWCVKVLMKLPTRSGALFPGQNMAHINVETPRITLVKALHKKTTMHGCRSTFRDWCAENGKDPVLAEKSLMHATGNAVQLAYQRSDLLEQRRVLMQEWANTVMSLIET